MEQSEVLSQQKKNKMEKREQTYEQAMKRLEEIVKAIDGGKLGIDSLSEYLKEAQALIQFCREKLYQTDQDIQKLLTPDDQNEA
jgi:exodeoxyribonuclease VII small subunit